MTLLTTPSLNAAEIVLSNVGGHPTAGTYPELVKILLALRAASGSGETFHPEPPPESRERRPPVGGARVYGFKNMVFADLATPITASDVYAQIFDHKITFARKASTNTWEVVDARFQLRTCNRAYPKPHRGVKIYYTLDKADGSGSINVMDSTNPAEPDPASANPWQVEASYTKDKAITGTHIEPSGSSQVYDTGVTWTSNNLKSAFSAIRWNLAAKIEWKLI